MGYTIPVNLTKKPASTRSASTSRARTSPTGRRLKKNTKYVDPEAAINRKSGNDDSINNQAYYPWPKTFMFGIDITF